ncbi:BTB/POZ domain containing protein, expressed [Panicum miliaceum]|uniref:BTB/POZ domain containing protein, expressed n=1 Tax=Panicum miliaceum TaxID=4540 RepID=A0A3L6S7J2_PANMI|nr:BTB/POZ domain containing protein, expressed [Panicum miliaceum]
MPVSSPAAAGGGGGVSWRSGSAIVDGVETGFHVLKIIGYSRTKDVPNGKRIESRPFRVGGSTWHVRYYPNGGNSGVIDFLSLYLHLEDTFNKAVKTQVKISLLDQDGKPVPSSALSPKSVNFSDDTPIVVVPPSDMHRHFGDLLLSKEGADVKFRVRKRKFHAHRSVLAARSPVFKKVLLGLMKEGASINTIPIDDMEN